MDSPTDSTPLPSFADTLAKNPGWLDEAVDTKGASKIIHEPPATLETKRSRGGGPVFIKLGPKAGSKVVYTRRACFEYLRARQRASTSDTGEVAA